jgi:glycerol-3-phosphate cytidylyltransferase
MNVLVIGVFDLFHRGHVELLRRSSAMGDKVFVIINGDKMTTQYKRKPWFSEEDRMEIVKTSQFVDQAVISNEFDVKPYIEKFDIDIIVHGDDWGHESYMEQIKVTETYLEEQSVKIEYLPYYDGVSTSGLISEIKSE